MNNDQICFVSKNVIENGFEINRFFRTNHEDDELSGWFFLFGDEDDDFFESRDNFVPERLSTVILNKPFIRNFVDKPAGSDFAIDSETGKILDFGVKHSYSFDRNLYAPNATQIKLEPLVWLKYHPRKKVLPVLAVLFLILAIFHFWAWILITIYFLLLIVTDWVATFERFKYGESLPALVVSAEPCLIAVTTVMEIRSGFHRYVKVLEIKSIVKENEKLKIGDKIATSTLYPQSKLFGVQTNAVDFQPIPINYATANKEVINQAISNYHESEWTKLEEAINKLEMPYRIGLYQILLDSDKEGHLQDE